MHNGGSGGGGVFSFASNGGVSPSSSANLSDAALSCDINGDTTLLTPHLSPNAGSLASPTLDSTTVAFNDTTLSDRDRDVCSPSGVEMHTFRDAIDVNYQRMALTGDEHSGVPLEDIKASRRLLPSRCISNSHSFQLASEQLVAALRLRHEYQERMGGHFPTTTRSFLTGEYPENLPKQRCKNTTSCEFFWLPTLYNKY